MGFLDANGAGGVFVEVGDVEHKRLLRPLADKPTPIWGHAVPTPETAVTLSSGKAEVLRLRDYHFEICTATNRRGVGCRLCNRQDQAWPFLSERDKTNKKGQRVDFPKRCQYVLPVWDYEEGEVKVLVGGNQLFEEMAKFSDQEGRDVRTCDWKVWKTGQSKGTHYWSARQDASAFTIEVGEQMIKDAMGEAMADRYTPLKDDELQRKLLPMTPEEARASREKEGERGAAPVASQLPGQTADNRALPAPTDDARVIAARALFPGKTDDEIKAILAAVGGTPGNFKVAPQGSSPAAQQAPTKLSAIQYNENWDGDPATYVVEQGKHAGKKLADLVTLDIKHVEFLRAQGYNDVVKGMALAILNTKPVMPEPVKAIVSAPAPSAPPVTQKDGSVVQQQQPEAKVSDNEEQRLVLVKECKTLVGQIKDYQGPGLSRNFIPLLKGITSTKRLNYQEEWNVHELQTLKAKLNEKLGNVPANPHLSA